MKYRLLCGLLGVVLLTSCERSEATVYNEDDYKVTTSSGYLSTALTEQTTAVTTTAAVTTDPPVTEPEKKPDTYNIDVECIYQNPQLPTGCEITSLTMLLNYLGFDVSKTEMAADYLTKDYKGDVGFDKAFIGDPTWYGGYGCFAPVIKEAADKYLKAQKSEYKALDVSGKSLEELYEYIADDIPVVTWCSMDLINVYRHYCFNDAQGNEVYWYDNEHCVLLCGYDRENNTVTAADPLNGIVRYNAGRFEEIYNELEKQAVIIEKVQ